MTARNPLRPRAPLSPSQDALRQRSFRFAAWLVEPTAARATHPDHGAVRLSGDEALVLVLLADGAGGVVPAEAFRATLWPDAETPPLEAAIASLCRTLHLRQDATDSPIVAHGDGYRLAVPVELIASDSGRWHAGADEDDDDDDDPGPSSAGWWLDRWPLAVAAGTLVVIALIAWWLRTG